MITLLIACPGYLVIYSKIGGIYLTAADGDQLTSTARLHRSSFVTIKLPFAPSSRNPVRNETNTCNKARPHKWIIVAERRPGCSLLKSFQSARFSCVSVRGAHTGWLLSLTRTGDTYKMKKDELQPPLEAMQQTCNGCITEGLFRLKRSAPLCFSQPLAHLFLQRLQPHRAEMSVIYGFKIGLHNVVNGPHLSQIWFLGLKRDGHLPFSLICKRITPPPLLWG